MFLHSRHLFVFFFALFPSSCLSAFLANSILRCTVIRFESASTSTSTTVTMCQCIRTCSRCSFKEKRASRCIFGCVMPCRHSTALYITCTPWRSRTVQAQTRFEFSFSLGVLGLPFTFSPSLCSDRSYNLAETLEYISHAASTASNARQWLCFDCGLNTKQLLKEQ